MDWYFVATNSLWVVGAAILLAGFSWRDWLTRERRHLYDIRRVAPHSAPPKRMMLQRGMTAGDAALSWQLTRAVGCLMVASSQALARNRASWERSLWIVV